MPAAPRPFAKHSIDQLESLAELDSTNRGALQALVAELRHRKTKRAASLLLKVEAKLKDQVSSSEQKRASGPPASAKREQPVQVLKPSQVRSPAKATPDIDKSHTSSTPDSTAETRSRTQVATETGSEELAPHLQEFIEALKEEIEAAKRNLGGNAALLSDGRLIAPVGAGFHYRFQSQRPLRVPPDTPGFLAIPGASEDLPVSVVSIEDLSVVLELPKHVGGSVAQAKLKTDLTMLLLKLIERIETKGVDSHPAADRVLGFRVPSSQQKPFTAQNDKLNAEQRLAVESVLGSDTVFIWGPPGTGKTQTIGEIGTQLFKGKQTLLIASHTNTAVDEALIRIAKALDGEIKEGDVLRLGEPVKSELQARPDLILKRVAEKRSAELEAQKRAAEQAKATALTELETLHRKVDICEWLAEADDDLAAFEAREKAVSQAEAEIRHLQKLVSESSLRSALWDEKRTKAEAMLKAIGEQWHIEDDLGRHRDQLAANHRSALGRV